ncbi:hypothetical protein [Pontibacter ruber]|uniref:asparagine synthase (glutamine-hydrolyzing) n=1 Tax=Pontibacter ruber TaxID=1343895 RepID=A0ABW5CSB3_9BACT|nr:hypothetical protein [Pontibacter ruber]
MSKFFGIYHLNQKSSNNTFDYFNKYYKNFKNKSFYQNGNLSISSASISETIPTYWSDVIFDKNGTVFISVYGNIIDLEKNKNYNDKLSKCENIYNIIKTEGYNAIKNLSGLFSLVVYNSFLDELTIISDRGGFFPIFYITTNEYIAFSTEVKFLNQLNNVPEINKVALHERLFFGYVLGNHTLITNICRLPVGTYLKVKERKVQLINFWSWNDISKTIIYDYNIALEQGAKIIPTSLTKYYDYRKKYQLLLSGGFDSRFIASEISKFNEGENIKGISIHKPNSTKDVKIASVLAKTLRVPFKTITYKKSKMYDDFVLKCWMVDGLSNEHLWAVPLIDQLDQDSIILDGFAGDGFLSGSYEIETKFGFNKLDGDIHLIKSLEEEYATFFTERYLSDKIIKTSINIELGNKGINSNLIFGLKNRLRNAMILMAKNIWENGGIILYPLADNNIQEYSFSIDPDIRRRKTLNKDIQAYLYPNLVFLNNLSQPTYLEKLKHLLKQKFDLGNSLPKEGTKEIERLLNILNIEEPFKADEVKRLFYNMKSYNDFKKMLNILDVIVWHNLYILKRNINDFLGS